MKRIAIFLLLINTISLAQNKSNLILERQLEFNTQELFSKIGVKRILKYRADTLTKDTNYMTLKEIEHYDKYGRIILTQYLESETDTISISYEYDIKTGFLIKKIWKGVDMYPIEYIYTYKKNGEQISEKSGGAEPRDYTLEYKNGKLTLKKGKCVGFDVNDNALWFSCERYTYFYNKKGLLELEKFFYKEEEYSATKYLYNSNNQITEKLIYFQGDPASFFKTTYGYTPTNLIEYQYINDLRNEEKYFQIFNYIFK